MAANPLYRATRLERDLDTPARIYFKYEGTSPAGSHKPNTAIAQAFYNKQSGVKRVSTETGAGQWGSSLALAANMFGLECLVFMVKASFEQKPYRRIFMETFGAEVRPSPSSTTQAGKKVLEADPDSTGSLGIAISEAIEVAATNEDTHYSIGSCLNHVLLHQSVVGLEARRQMELADEVPDVVVGCVGGGSNYGGLAYPFMAGAFAATRPTCDSSRPSRSLVRRSRRAGSPTTSATRRSSRRCCRCTRSGTISCRRRCTPAASVPRRRPSLSLLVRDGYMEAAAYSQNEVFEAAVLFAKTQGIIPAPESAHAIRGAVNEAIAAERRVASVILLGLSGHGHFDMQAYDDYLNDRLPEVEFDPEQEAAALARVPNVPIG